MRPTRSTCSLSSEFSLVRENILSQNERITQLYVIQSENNPYLWLGALFIDTGIYAGAVMRFIIMIDDTYPDCPCPRVLFEPIPYHPLVDINTGYLDTKNAFPDWSSRTHRLHYLLSFIKRVIHNSEMYIREIQDLVRQDALLNGQQTQSSFDRIDGTGMDESNHSYLQRDTATGLIDHYSPSLINLFDNFNHTIECIKTYELNPSEFQRRVDDFKRKCFQSLLDRPTIYGDDRNALIFTPWDQDIHEPLRRRILEGRYAPASLLASYQKDTDSVSFIPGAGNP